MDSDTLARAAAFIDAAVARADATFVGHARIDILHLARLARAAVAVEHGVPTWWVDYNNEHGDRCHCCGADGDADGHPCSWRDLVHDLDCWRGELCAALAALAEGEASDGQ